MSTAFQPRPPEPNELSLRWLTLHHTRVRYDCAIDRIKVLRVSEVSFQDRYEYPECDGVGVGAFTMRWYRGADGVVVLRCRERWPHWEDLVL